MDIQLNIEYKVISHRQELKFPPRFSEDLKFIF